VEGKTLHQRPKNPDTARSALNLSIPALATLRQHRRARPGDPLQPNAFPPKKISPKISG